MMVPGGFVDFFDGLDSNNALNNNTQIIEKKSIGLRTTEKRISFFSRFDHHDRPQSNRITKNLMSKGFGPIFVRGVSSGPPGLLDQDGFWVWVDPFYRLQATRPA